MPSKETAPPDLTLENRRLLFRNLRGLEDRFNAPGNRNFSVLLKREEAERLAKLGWNVRELKVREEDTDPDFSIKVNVRYRARDGRVLRPPKIVLVTSGGKTPLDEEAVGALDMADILFADIMLTPYYYSTASGEGYSAYVKTMFVTIREDALEMKYRDIDDSTGSTSAMMRGEAFEGIDED